MVDVARILGQLHSAAFTAIIGSFAKKDDDLNWRPDYLLDSLARESHLVGNLLICQAGGIEAQDCVSPFHRSLRSLRIVATDVSVVHDSILCSYMVRVNSTLVPLNYKNS